MCLQEVAKDTRHTNVGDDQFVAARKIEGLLINF